MSTNKGDVRVVEPTRAQRAIARRAAESRATVPHLELSADVECGGESSLAGVVSACGLALREVPRGNASYRDGRFELYSRINVGVVMATADAFLIPTIFDADTKSVSELESELDGLRSRAAAGELSPPELAGATFTVSEVRAHSSGPLIVSPQAAALCAGAPRQAPVIRDGSVCTGTVLTITLACDHRILYGTEAAELLAAISLHLKETSP